MHTLLTEPARLHIAIYMLTAQCPRSNKLKTCNVKNKGVKYKAKFDKEDKAKGKAGNTTMRVILLTSFFSMTNYKLLDQL